MTTEIGTTTTSFAEGKELSNDLRAATPQAMQAMFQRLEHISKTAVDYVVPASDLTARVTPEGEVRASFGVSDSPLGDAALDFGIGRIAHEQFSEKLDIPGRYYKRMHTEAPGLLTNNLNYWFANDGGYDGNLLLRTLDGRLRAVLSDRFRVLDSYDLAFHVWDTAKTAEAIVQRMDLSEDRFYMRLLAPGFGEKITGRGKEIAQMGLFAPSYKRDNGTWQGMDDKTLDWVFPMIVCRNSDVGRGGLTVEGGAVVAACSNLILVSQTLHRVHLGERVVTGLRISSETQEAKDKAVWLEVRDLVRAMFDPTEFKTMVERMNNAQNEELEEPAEAINVIAKNYGMSDADRQAILNELISPACGVQRGATVWGLVNAVTAIQHGKSIEDEYKLAEIGGDLLEKAHEMVPVRVRK